MDIRIWMHGKKGDYSVKSGYKVNMQLLSNLEDYKKPKDWDLL